jgi:hypothetical protein
MRVAGRTLSLLLVVVLVAGCSLDWLGLEPESTPVSPAMESYLATLREIGLDRYIGIEPVYEWELGNSGWVQYGYDEADCRCIDGGPFHVLARPGAEVEGESSPYTLFWMSGGGACWPGQDACATRATLSQSMTFGLGSQTQANPVRDWNMISVPYCDGSLHAGDNDADYDKDDVVDHYHHGLKTTSAAVTLMKELFPQSTKILIAGCGAGGYGTIVATPLIRLRFPTAQLYIWNENGPGFYLPRQREYVQPIVEAWKLDAYLPEDCPECRTEPVNLYTWLLTRDSGLKLGLFSTYEDTAAEERFLEATRRLENASEDNFKYYLAWSDSTWGDSACVDDYSRAAECIPIHDWIKAMVTDSAKWDNVHGPPCPREP